MLSSYPHDPRAFLQGWLWHDGGFYESTGLNGESTLRRVAFPSGEVVQKIDVPKQYFAEGLAMVGDRLIQLTWRTKKAFIYDRESFGLLGEFPYETEGWGLTYDGTSLIMSDGSANLFFLDPETYQVDTDAAGHAGRAPAPAAQRAGVDQGRDLVQRLADRHDRPDRPDPAGRSSACWT